MPPTDLVMHAPMVSTDEIVPTGNDIESQLRHAVGPQSYQLWFRDRTSFAIHSDELVVGVANPFLLNWMQRQFREPIGRVALSLIGPAARVRFEIDGSLSLVADAAGARRDAPKSASNANADAGCLAHDVGCTQRTQPETHRSLARLSGTGDRGQETGDRRSETQQSLARLSAELATSNARSGQTTAVARPTAGNTGRRFSDLADLIVGSCNQLAVTAARQVCDAPGERLNPLYLFGGVGLGKTHVLEGLYLELRRRFTTWNIVFLTSEQFANYFTHALRTHTLPSFRQRFRGVDVLLVDDIEFLEGTRVIQQEFLHTIKTLEDHGKQLIVTAERHPRLLTKLSEELTTRFSSGLVCRLEAPDLETRTRIVQHKLINRELDLAPEAVTLVAQWFRQNVRELEGALNCLETHFAWRRQRLTAAAARQILADLQRDCVRIVRLTDVERVICDLFRIIPDELRSASRARNVSQPRMLAMFLARKLTQAAYSEIGEFFGGRNHSTVISAEKQVQSWLFEETKLTVASREWTVGELLTTLEQQLLAS